jgi:hypothetical protein
MTWLNKGFTTMLNIELCNLTKIMSSGLNGSTEEAMAMTGTRGMIEETMTSASVKMNRRNTRRPSSLYIIPFLPYPARLMILNHPQMKPMLHTNHQSPRVK